MNKNFLNNFVVLLSKYMNVWNTRGKIPEKTDLDFLENSIEFWSWVFNALTFETFLSQKVDIKEKKGWLFSFFFSL